MPTRGGPNPARSWPWLAHCCSRVACSMPTAHAAPLARRFAPGRRNSPLACSPLGRPRPSPPYGLQVRMLAHMPTREGPNPARPWPWLARWCSRVAYGMPTAHAVPLARRFAPGRRISALACSRLGRPRAGRMGTCQVGTLPHMPTRKGPNPPRPWPWLLCCCSLVAYSMPTAHAEPPTHRFAPGRRNSLPACSPPSRPRPPPSYAL